MLVKRHNVIRFFILNCLLLSFLFPFAQQDTSGTYLFDKGIKYFENKKVDSAIAVFKQIVAQRIGTSSYIYGNSFFNIPTLYGVLGQLGDAKTWYLKVLESDVRDNFETGDIMEPHTNYKHKSAMRLALIAEKDSNYAEALQWLNRADTVYRYWGFEGSATNISKKKAVILEWKSDLMIQLHQEQEAINAIVYELICSHGLEGFFSNSESQLMHLLGSERHSFKSELDNAINNAHISKTDAIQTIVSFKLNAFTFNIPFHTVRPDRAIPHYWSIIFIPKDKNINKEYFIGYIKDREFYKRLAQ